MAHGRPASNAGLAPSIGVFDSGLGGLSVLAHLRRMLPDRPLIYLADQARAPYGDRPPKAVLGWSEEITAHLLDEGSEAVVVACNTASSVALERLRARFAGATIVGMEPAVKPAVAASRTGTVGVLATTGTVEGTRLARLIGEHAGSVNVLTQACPGLVELVEDGLTARTQAASLVDSYVTPLINAGADTLVLGCTHYSFLVETVAAAAGPDVTIIDPAEAVARRTASVTKGDDARPGVTASSSVRFMTTGDPVRFRMQLRELLGEDHPTHHVSPERLGAPADIR